MLRRVVQLLAAALLIGGACLLAAGVPQPGVPLLLLGAIVFTALRFERWRGRAKPPPAGAAWQRTGERFEDPGSGKTIEVHYNAHTGERRYKPEDES